MQDTILKICKQIHELLPTKRIAITRFVGKYEYGQIYVGELDRKVKREPCAFMFIKRDFCVVYSQDPAKNQEEARQDFELVCRTLEDHCAFLFEPRWYKTFFDVFETTLILEFQVWERYERYPGSAIPVMETLESDYPNVVYDGSFVLSFTNTEHPDFTVELPDDIVADKNSYVKLPSVSGEHEEGGETWAPYAWDIGEFGQSIKMDSNKVANLLWEVVQRFVVSFANTTYPQFDVDIPEQIVVREGESITLPSVSGQFVEGGYVYTPSAWDIGDFGSKFTPTGDTIANLVFNAEKQYQEITLYLVSGTKQMQTSVTSSFVGSVSYDRFYRLYTDEECTTPWNDYDYSNNYEIGYYNSSGDWVTYPIQSVADMPSTTTTVTHDAKSGRLILDTGSIWLFTNYTYSGTYGVNLNSIKVRIYPKDQSLNYHVGYFYSNNAYGNRSGNLSLWPLYTAPGTSTQMTYFGGTTIIGLYGSAGNSVALTADDVLTYYQQDSTWRTFRFKPTPQRSMAIRAIVFTTPKS